MKSLPLNRIAATSVLAGLLTSSASAIGFVNNKDGWLALTQEAKAAYVQGLNDSINQVFVDDNLVEGLAKRGRTLCLAESQENAAGLAQRITTAYSDERYVNLTPTSVYIITMGQLCRTYINRERATFGLGPV